MIKVSKFVGVNTDYLTSQAFIFPKSAADLPYLSVIISGSGEDIFSRVRVAGGSLEEIFYSSAESISNRISKLFEHLGEELRELNNPQILVTVLVGDILYLKSQGSHQAFLKRGEKVTELTSSVSDDALISGFIKPGDKLLMVNAKIYSEEEEVSEKPKVWEKEFIDNLLSSDTEGLEEGVEALLSQSAQLNEPISVVMLEDVLQEKKIENFFPELEEVREKRKFAFPKISLPFKLKHFLPFVFRKIPITIKQRLILGAIAIIILLLSGIFLFYKHNLDSKNSTQAITLTSSRAKLAQAMLQKDADPEGAQKSLSEAKIGVVSVLKQNPKNKDAQTLLKDLDVASKEILKIYEISNPTVFLSLDLIKSDFKTSKMSFSLGNILLLDDTQKTLVLMGLSNKNNQILAGVSQLGQAKFASLNGSQALIYSDDKGVLSIDTQSKKITQVAKPDPDWGKISDIFGFGSNVYLLDTLKNQIWKYSPTQSGYTEKFPYIQDNSKSDLAGGLKLAIDYSVWVLKTGPEILRYTGGSPDFYSIGGIDEDVKELRSIFPTEEADTVYMLDTENKRMVVTKKNGAYLSQYTGDIFTTSSDVVVDEESKKIYLLSEGKIYQIDLK